MKKISLFILFVLLSTFAFAQPSLPFSKGVNMLTWFETFQARLPNLNKYDETDFEMLKSMDIDVVRLPIHFDLVMEPVNTGTINKLVLEKLDQVCDWAEKSRFILLLIIIRLIQKNGITILQVQNCTKKILKLYGRRLHRVIKTEANTLFMK